MQTDELRHTTPSVGGVHPCPPPHQFAPQLCPFHLSSSCPHPGLLPVPCLKSRRCLELRRYPQHSGHFWTRRHVSPSRRVLLTRDEPKIYEPVHFNELATGGASICYQAVKLPEWANVTLVNSLSKRPDNFQFESLRYGDLGIYNIAYNIHSASFTRPNYTTRTG